MLNRVYYVIKNMADLFKRYLSFQREKYFLVSYMKRNF